MRMRRHGWRLRRSGIVRGDSEGKVGGAGIRAIGPRGGVARRGMGLPFRRTRTLPPGLWLITVRRPGRLRRRRRRCAPLPPAGPGNPGAGGRDLTSSVRCPETAATGSPQERRANRTPRATNPGRTTTGTTPSFRSRPPTSLLPWHTPPQTH